MGIPTGSPRCTREGEGLPWIAMEHNKLQLTGGAGAGLQIKELKTESWQGTL